MTTVTAAPAKRDQRPRTFGAPAGTREAQRARPRTRRQTRTGFDSRPRRSLLA